MSSILTNTSAMTALQTLKGINSDLAKTQDEISTGKKVANAKDNAAIFAISKVMESDVAGFKALSESLSLGSSTIAVASNATQQIGGLLEEIKGKIVAANEDNVDRSVLQGEIGRLRDQISGIVGAAQFNGQNLLQSDETTSILASLDRSSSGAVTANSIEVSGRDFGTASGTAGTDPGGKNASLSGSGVSASTDSLVLTGNGSFLSDPADNFRVTVDGVQIDATLSNMEAAGVVASGAGTATDEEVAEYVAGVINGDFPDDSLGMEGVTATVTDDGSGNAGIDISSRSSEEITLNAVAADNSGGNVAVGTPFAGSLAAVTGEINTRATATIDFSDPAGSTDEYTDAGDTVTVNVGPDTYTYTAAAANSDAADMVADIVTAFNAELDDKGITSYRFEASAGNNGASALTVANFDTTQSYEVSFTSSASNNNGTASIDAPTVDAATANATDINISGNILEGDSFAVNVGTDEITYVAGKNETANDVIRGLQNVLAADGPAGLSSALTF
ncbi:MAG: hypothetical protein GVY28_14180, partial [Alphaproteobacteria bacterium]|nr:hypothetical protein [Alphaproteobacteria bacterium]